MKHDNQQQSNLPDGLAAPARRALAAAGCLRLEQLAMLSFAVPSARGNCRSPRGAIGSDSQERRLVN